MYNKNSFTWGFELEVGDVDRRLTIPENLGEWEFSETDIVNMHTPYKGAAADPLGLEPHWGGEINVKPAKTINEILDKIEQILQFFKDNGNTPTSNCISHSHIHVRIPGLKDDINSLKKLIVYIKENQHIVIDKCHNFRLDPLMSSTKTAKTYLKWDGGRPMPNYMCDNIINLATDFDSFIKLHAAGKDGISMGRPFRYAINTYCMKHIDTVEFRMFRNTLKREELEACFKFVERFMDCALNNGPDVQEILLETSYMFPQLQYDHEAYLKWEQSKYDKSRGNKVRKFYEI